MFDQNDDYRDLEMKLFTVEEANKLIPMVRPKLETIKNHYAKIQSYREKARAAADSAQFGGGGMKGGSQYATLLFELGQLTAELDGHGIQLKDYSRGLIDFPYKHEGRIVLLCWQLGDGDEIEWWHDIEAGFRGRTRL